MWCDGIVTVVEIHVAVNMKPGHGDQRRFNRPFACFDDEDEAWNIAKKCIAPGLFTLANETLGEDEEWNYLLKGQDFNELQAEAGDNDVTYKGAFTNEDIESVVIGFCKFEVPMNPGC
jgi:hypothetical protein